MTARRRVAEPLVRWQPSGGRLGGLGVPAPPLDRRRPGGPRIGDLGKVRDRRGRLVHVPCAEYQTHPPVQLLKVKLSQGVVLAEQANEAFAVSLRGQRPRTAGRGTSHGYPAGRTMTAVP
jgi:hypothetical protein